MAWNFTHRRRVAFSETDLAGIMHFANFFRWMEETEHAFFRSLGHSVHPLQNGATNAHVGWPRVSAKCEYALPLRFEEEVDVELLVAEIKAKAITYRFLFRKLDAAKSIAAVGELVVVAVTADPETGRMKSVNIAPTLLQLIQVAPAEALSQTNSIRKPKS